MTSVISNYEMNCVLIHRDRRIIKIFVIYSITGELMFLNEATFLDNLRTRYFKDKIYVSMKIGCRQINTSISS